MATVFRLFGDSDTSMRTFQIICDAAAAVLLFFVAAELLPTKLAAIAGALAALSPLKGAGYGCFLAILVAIPLYYLASQSFLHAEYRYVMAIQPPLFILVAVTLYWLGTMSARIISKRAA